MKRILVLLAVVLAMMLAMPLVASPSAIDPVMSLDTMAGAGAVISAAAVAEEPRAPLVAESLVLSVIVSILIAALIGSAAILIYSGRGQGIRRRRMIHFARDQPAAAA